MAAINTGSARAYYGLQATAEPTSEGTAGTLTIGQASTSQPLSGPTRAIVLGIEVDSTNEVDLNLVTMQPTLTGSGVAQVETATAAGTIGTSGNATVVVTGDDITGSPLTVSVAVTSGDTAATWAGKVRTALGAVTAITSKYTVGGSSTAISLTRTAARYNDSTLNISLANGTCTGITAAPTSANTTAGVNPPKCWRISGTAYAGDDFEGVDFANASNIYGFQARHIGGGTTSIENTTGFSDKLEFGDVIQKNSDGENSMISFALQSGNTLTIASDDGSYSKLIITLMFD